MFWGDWQITIAIYRQYQAGLRLVLESFIANLEANLRCKTSIYQAKMLQLYFSIYKEFKENDKVIKYRFTKQVLKIRLQAMLLCTAVRMRTGVGELRTFGGPTFRMVQSYIFRSKVLFANFSQKSFAPRKFGFQPEGFIFDKF